MPVRKTTQEVIDRFRSLHGDRYDYSLVEYHNSSTKVTVICKQHGSFSIRPEHHWKGVRCKKCAALSLSLSKAEFVERSRVHFGEKFDYSKFSVLPAFGVKVPIQCMMHGLIFFQEPRNHMRGHLGCPKCKSLILSGPAGTAGTHRLEASLTSAFVSKAQEIHGERYDYSQFAYVTSAHKGTIICRKHGAFDQSPSNHLRGTNCPICAKEQFSADTFKEKCRELGINYWRALKRRASGQPEDKVFTADSIRTDRATSPVTVHEITYPNKHSAIRALTPPASPKTIARWIRAGVSPEEAFQKVPNPGYAEGIIYLVTHIATGKKYVGITIQTMERRWRYHLDQARAGSVKSQASLHKAIRQFGESAFKIEQIDSGQSKSTLEAKERQWIKVMNSLQPSGFNISTGGTSGGSNSKPTKVDGQSFPSMGAAAEYVAQTRGVSLDAAVWRIRNQKIDARAPAKPGKSLVKTTAYKVWSRIIHCATNPNSKDYISDTPVCERWRDFFAFLEDVGQPTEKGMAFARKDKSEGFSPNNCAWMSKSAASKINAAHMKKSGSLSGRPKKS